MVRTVKSFKLRIIFNISFLLSLFAFALTLQTSNTFAGNPSYNCSGRLTPNERLICSRDDLSELDREVADAFHELTAILNRAAANLVRRDQSQWLRQRQKCKRNVVCTRNLYLLRIDELANSLSEQRDFRTPRKNTEQDKVNREQSNQDRVNCALRGLYQLGGVCVNTCPPDWVAEPRGKICREMTEEERNGGLCSPGFTNVRGKCIHNSELQKKQKFQTPKHNGSLPNGIYGIYVLAHGDSLRVDHTADKLLYTQNKSGNPNEPKQPFRLTYHKGSYIITDITSGLRLHADGNGDWKVSLRYQPKDDFTKFNITPANEGCFFIQTEASANYWIWEPNSQTIQVRPQSAGEESMFCFQKQ